ncbi:MAG: hypothetical protein MI861_26655, partial [Pirellulales bacterium]|nr:hypothetical protein [Pirellulales bacterium]
VVSEQTTVITAPLGSDGLPDYKLAKQQRDLNGVSAENNGAALFWRAMGNAGEYDPESWSKLGEYLGFDAQAHQSGLESYFGGDMHLDISSWVATHHNLELDDAQLDTPAILDHASWFPWRARECPPLADAFQRHAEHFRLLTEVIDRLSVAYRFRC